MISLLISFVSLGTAAKWVMRVFSVILLVLCGTVFVTSPAGLLDKLTPDWMNGTFWAVVILIYYLTAKEELRLETVPAYWIGGILAVALFAVYCILWARSRRSGRTNIQTEEVNGNET